MPSVVPVVTEGGDGTSTTMTLRIGGPQSIGDARPRPLPEPRRLRIAPLDATAGDEVLAATRTDPLESFYQARGAALQTGAGAARAIAAGAHEVWIVDGRRLRFPSQDLVKIESRRPSAPGQTHTLARHVGTTLAENVARLAAWPLLRAAGSFTSLADAQFATDRTIANPANQHDIGAFLADPGRLKVALQRVELGRMVGTTTLRSDVTAGRAALIPGTTATVVLIKDPSFPEGYRVLTTYPDTRRPEVDERGNPLI